MDVRGDPAPSQVVGARGPAVGRSSSVAAPLPRATLPLRGSRAAQRGGPAATACAETVYVRALRPGEARHGAWRERRATVLSACKIVTWLILPVVICLSQRLSHACLSISNYTVKLRMAH
jgi:hypothetical protein